VLETTKGLVFPKFHVLRETKTTGYGIVVAEAFSERCISKKKKNTSEAKA
jgi:hypothetical protein